MKKNYGSTGRDIIFACVSVTVVFIFTSILIVLSIFKSNDEGNWEWLQIDLPLSFFYFAFWFGFGIFLLWRISRFKKYKKIVGKYPRFKIGAIAKIAKRDLKRVSADLIIMCKLGWFDNAVIDKENKEIVFVEGSEPLPFLEGEGDTVYKKKNGFPKAAFAAAVFTMLFFFRVFILSDVHWGMQIILLCMTALFFLMLCMGVFILMLWIAPTPSYFIEVPRPVVSVKKPQFKNEDEEFKAAMMTVYENKKELVRLSGVIIAPQIKQPLGEIIRVLDEITAYVTENPAKIRELRQFVNYYLPTTVSFIVTYEELSSKPNKGENIQTSLMKIEEIASNMVDLFKKEYDDMFSDKAMDISAEIQVMRNIIEENQ